MEQFELVTLKSGVISLRSRDNDETFHPVTGPRVEAQRLHVEQQRLPERCAAKQGRFVIWDVGLGAAANALTAIESLRETSGEVQLHSFDRTTGPLEFALTHARELGYLLGHENDVRELLANGQATPASHIQWKLHRGDFREVLFSDAIPAPDAIFYDPYSPTTNIDMWTLEHFRSLHSRLAPTAPCLLTNYTCSTAVRATLLLAGFYVGIGSGVGEKVETTIASNSLDALEQPLGRDWLKRVHISHSAAPLREAPRTIAPISDEDFERLVQLPQFALNLTGVS